MRGQDTWSSYGRLLPKQKLAALKVRKTITTQFFKHNAI